MQNFICLLKTTLTLHLYVDISNKFQVLWTTLKDLFVSILNAREFFTPPNEAVSPDLWII